ncbi:heme exporter protein CcmB [Salmonella enterica subsp. enterica]|nr:heme exporter protein CcmB [Salmonella enterica subsp. enterica]
MVLAKVLAHWAVTGLPAADYALPAGAGAAAGDGRVMAGKSWRWTLLLGTPALLPRRASRWTAGYRRGGVLLASLVLLLSVLVLISPPRRWTRHRCILPSVDGYLAVAGRCWRAAQR